MNQSLRASAYLSRLPPAIAGQGGHAATFAAACLLVEFGLNYEEAFQVLLAWNQTRCQPPWTETELQHKLTDAFKKAHPLARFTNGRRQSCDRLGSRYAGIVTAPLPTSRDGRLQLALPKRALTAGTESQHATLASLRRISDEAVTLASERGLVRFGPYCELPAWFVLDSSHRMAQARRMDGRPWFDDVKALTLTGGQAQWPVGIKEAQPFRTVAFCEGGPDLLAAFHFIISEQRQSDCAPVVMLAGAASIHPAALPLFTGKTVRIYGHTDKAGETAALRWFTQLESTGATADCFSFDDLSRFDGSLVKDLNDFVQLHPDDAHMSPHLQTILP